MRAGKFALSLTALTMIVAGTQAASVQAAATLDNATCPLTASERRAADAVLLGTASKRARKPR